ncbi:hypothetical protein EZ456_13265 [Pedobacter psychrodurus]|uniref:Uncharacterized protein n=1 Tax=Pedobacter psychrodurus TaxID=2530456 RepID=A0A4R0Q2G9_9SPHI|nr:hypothetical protein [Pedobacter psychrodurus]TCD26553.1 hypothetical protein EZ456_13265 [Pedobacter psychrodurus]
MMNSKKIREAKYFELGRQAERDGLLKEAVKQYLLLLKNKPAHIDANNRLMMAYRKLHEYSKEIELIKKAVNALEQETERQQQRYIDEHPEKASDTRALAMSLGLLGKKGLPLIENEVVARWQKRLQIVQKKLERIKH